MESLDEAVGLGMVRRRHKSLDAPGAGQLLKNVRGELRAPVGGYSRRDAVVLYPSVSEGVCDALGRDVGYGDGYRPS